MKLDAMKIRKSIWMNLLLVLLLTGGKAYAGNEDRAGSAGGSQLLINPWATSSGLMGANGAYIEGLGATQLNVAGLAFVDKTEIMFTRTSWLTGSQININSAGVAQSVGDHSALALTVMTMNFGDIPITTTDNPEGGIGTFSPSNANIGLSYSKGFSSSIYGGVSIKVLSEAIADAKAQGVALDAGLRYITGEEDQMKFGISLKNIGPPMSFSGDGLSFSSTGPADKNNMTVEHRSDQFELPSTLFIAGSYRFDLTEEHKVTPSATFQSNSFTKDQFRFGLQYKFKEYLTLRGGYLWEEGINDPALRSTVFTGPSGGLSVDVPVGQGSTKVGLDYSYRATNPFSGVHSIGARIVL